MKWSHLPFPPYSHLLPYVVTHSHETGKADSVGMSSYQHSPLFLFLLYQVPYLTYHSVKSNSGAQRELEYIFKKGCTKKRG